VDALLNPCDVDNALRVYGHDRTGIALTVRTQVVDYVFSVFKGHRFAVVRCDRVGEHEYFIVGIRRQKDSQCGS